MKFFKSWKNDALIAGIALALVLTIWVSGRAVNQETLPEIRTYGGQLPIQTNAALIRMHRDLERVQSIQSVKDNEITFLDDSSEMHTYQYKHQSLWCDDTPIAVHVQSFYFEYRDQYGNRLSLEMVQPSDICQIGYTIRAQSAGEDVVGYYRLEMRPVHNIPVQLAYQ